MPNTKTNKITTPLKNKFEEVKHGRLSLVELLNIFIIIIVSLFVVAELFFHSGRHMTFDGHTHMTTMAQFALALKDGEFPVVWSNNFANYGLPLPLFAHQLSAYLGAGLILLGIGVISSYNILMLLSVLVSNLLFYLFLRKSYSQNISLSAVLLMTLSPYRIINIYIRGGLPEVMATAIFPLLLIAIYKINRERNIIGGLYFMIGLALLALCHPMMLVIYCVPTIIFFLATTSKQTLKKNTTIIVVAGLLGIGISLYYLLPLFFEMKYFYAGLNEPILVENSFLNFTNYLDPHWYYYLTHPGPRGNLIKFGIIELIILLISVLHLLFTFIKARFNRNILKVNKTLIVWVTTSIIGVFLMSPFSSFLYQLFPKIAQIQYPWRFLSFLQFSIPIIFAQLLITLNKNYRNMILFCVIIIIFVSRIPQLYGKNFIDIPQDYFFFTHSNLHSVNLNPIWSARVEDYPLKSVQAQIIKGEGELQMVEIKNSSRSYLVISDSQVRLVDYTFYFPGWTLEIDGKPIDIEFQDPEYRGLITYRVPAGRHQVTIKYMPTKIRKLSIVLTTLSIFGGASFALYLKGLKSYQLKKYP